MNENDNNEDNMQKQIVLIISAIDVPPMLIREQKPSWAAMNVGKLSKKQRRIKF